jgi:hypothetical protein
VRKPSRIWRRCVHGISLTLSFGAAEISSSSDKSCVGFTATAFSDALDGRVGRTGVRMVQKVTGGYGNRRKKRKLFNPERYSPNATGSPARQKSYLTVSNSQPNNQPLLFGNVLVRRQNNFWNDLLPDRLRLETRQKTGRAAPGKVGLQHGAARSGNVVLLLRRMM